MDESKIHSRLLSAMTLGGKGAGDPGQIDEPEYPVIVRLTGARALGPLAAPVELMQVERRIDLVPSIAGVASRSELEALSESPQVAYIWYDEPVYAWLDGGTALVEVPPVWAGGNTGQGITICVVDTGVDGSHPDLEGRLRAAQDFTGQGEGDGHGHGTHVAGIAAGSGAASDGRYRGVAPDATLLSARVLQANGSGQMSWVMAGVEWAVEQGAQVINLSLGSRGGCDGSDALSAICDAAAEAGSVVVVAGGNDGPVASSVGSPGCAFKVVTVGAVDKEEQIADFSSRGPTLDGRVKPDLLLPGAAIVSARAAGSQMGEPVGEHYTRASGTSMACPFGAGIAALMLAANGALQPLEVKQLMIEAARSLDLPPNTQGHGLLVAHAAVTLAAGATPGPTPPPEPPPVPPPGPTPPPEPPPVPPPGPTPPPDNEGCLGAVARFLGWG